MKTDEVRQVAIEHHHLAAPAFEAAYAALERSKFSNAFTYGRAKIDEMVDELFALLPKGSSILDVGCGTGEHLKRAQRHGLSATGLEPAEGMMEAARRNVPEARLEKGVANRLPFGDAEFDAVLMIEVLRYLDDNDIRTALEEARRVLRPGGFIFVTLVNRWALDGFYVHQRFRQLRKRREFDERNPFCEFFTPRRAREALRQAGFSAVRTEGRLLAPIRIVEKVSKRAFTKLASVIDRFDDRVHRLRWTKPFAGHLIAIGRVPGAGGVK